MKRILLSVIIMLCAVAGFSQTDTTHKNSDDTVFVGNFIIIKNHKDGNTNQDSMPPRRDNYTIINIPGRRSYQAAPTNKTISTNYLILDLGFANYDDRTDYSNSAVEAYTNGLQKHDLKLITGKSSNVDIWLFMQKLNIASHVLNLKYGLGLEMFNFRYKYNITLTDKPEGILPPDTVDFSKNKLFVSYATVPFMININPKPNHTNGFSLSAGVSAGYRIGTHTKQVSDERGKIKNHSDFNLDDWRFAYVAELGIGPVHLYGSYSINPMFDNTIKQYPYTVGIRFSNW